MFADGSDSRSYTQDGKSGWVAETIYAPLLFLAILLAVANRMYALDFASLWSDELWGLWVCSLGSWPALLEDMVFHDSHPPGYQTFLYVWLGLFGDSDISVRLPSVIAGVVSVYSVCVFASKYFSRLIGLLSAAFLLTSFNAIYYSQEARAYSFILLFTIWHYHLLFLLFVDKSDRQLHRNLFTVVGALLAYFHYVGVVIVAAEALLFVVIPAFRRQLPKAIKLYGRIWLLYLPWFFVMIAHMLFPHESWERPVPDSTTLMKTFEFILGPDVNRLFFGLFSLLSFTLYFSFHWLKRSLQDSTWLLFYLLCLAFLPLAIFYIKTNVTVSAYTIRHFIYIIPVLCIINAWAIEWVFIRIFPEFRGVHVVALLALIVFVSQSINVSGSIDMPRLLYRDSLKHEYREATMVIASDEAFMRQDRRDVFVSNVFFNHYLKRFGVRTKPARFVHEFHPEHMPEYEGYIANDHIQDFYYMEILRNVEIRRFSPILQVFRKRYHAICQSEFKLVRTLKFTTRLPPNPGAKLSRCPRSEPDPAATSMPVLLKPAINEPPAGSAHPVLPAAQ